MWCTWFLDYIVWVWDPMLGLINNVQAPWWPFLAAALLLIWVLRFVYLVFPIRLYNDHKYSSPPSTKTLRDEQLLLEAWWNLSKLHLAFANFLKICPDFGNRPSGGPKVFLIGSNPFRFLEYSGVHHINEYVRCHIRGQCNSSMTESNINLKNLSWTK